MEFRRKAPVFGVAFSGKSLLLKFVSGKKVLAGSRIAAINFFIKKINELY